MTVVLTTAEEAVTVFNNWHQDIMYSLEYAQINANSPEAKDIIDKFISLIQDKPFTIDISINEEIMNGEIRYLGI